MMLVWQNASTSQQHCVRAPLISSARDSIVHFQVYVGMNAIMATPAMSALIRGRKLYGKSNNAFLPYKGKHDMWSCLKQEDKCSRMYGCSVDS